MKFYLYIFLSLCLMTTIACSSQQCRRKDKVPDMPGYQNMKKDDLEITPKTDPNLKTLKIFKYDGSLQCGMGKQIPLEQMAKDLGGITIYSQMNKHDGLMHIQACGTITGNANIYEVNEKDLSEALKRGFKVWNY